MTEEGILKEAWTTVTSRPFSAEEDENKITITLGQFRLLILTAMRAARREALRGN